MATKVIMLTSGEFISRIELAVKIYKEIRQKVDTKELFMCVRGYSSAEIQIGLGLACFAGVKAELFPTYMNPEVLYKRVLDEIRLDMPHRKNMTPVYRDYMYIFSNEEPILNGLNDLRKKWESGSPSQHLGLF